MLRLQKKLLQEKSYLTGKYSISPEFISLLLTFKCNFKCRSCSIWEKDHAHELTEDQWQKIFKDLGKNIYKDTFIELNGGEPLIRKDLVILAIAELKKHSSSVSLNSNGSLIDETMIRELEKAGLDTIKISLYSTDYETHDFLRGSSGAHKKALRALDLITNSRIKLEVGILITAQNIKEITKLIGYLNKLNNVKIILQPLDEMIESKVSKNKNTTVVIPELWPIREDTEKFFSWIEENPKNIKNHPAAIRAMKKYYLDPRSALNYRCFAGQRSLIIYPNGDTTLCFKGKVIGNALENDILEILENKNAINERLNIKQCQKNCRIVGCNFSRGFLEFARDTLKK